MLLLLGMGVITLCLGGRVVQAQTSEPTPTREPSAGAADHRFGIIEAFWSEEDAADLRVGWDRILFYWNEIQPTGPDDWNTLHVLEEWLTDAREQDRVVLGLLKNTPPWATDAMPYSGVPRGLYLPVDDPDNLWAGYVRKVVEYYAPLGVHNWIIWNEPEIEPGVYGHEFGGTTRDYYQLIKVAYQVAKQHDPEAVIHLAGWSYWHDPSWLGQFLSVATNDPDGAANDYFFDAITLHIYFRVETVEELVQETDAIQRRYGLQKPIWINETNASPNLDPLWPVVRPNFQVDLEQQAAYIVQAYALGFGAGAESIGVYKLLDVHLPEGGESFGILRPDGSRRPGFDAYRTTIEHLQGFTPPVGRQRETEFFAFSFRRPDNVTRVLWARDANDLLLRVPALADEALLVSATGDVERVIRPFNGQYAIRLRGARCSPACDIGGLPVFLIENVDDDFTLDDVLPINADIAVVATPTPTAEPTATLDPDALATLQAMPTETPTVTATVPPTATATPSPTITPSPTAAASPTPEPTDTTQPEPAEGANTPTSGSGGFALEELSAWLFIGAAVLLGGLLAVFAVRNRSG